ncbi:MAG TPA: cytidine deaminase [Candidatus Thermoplasmatota archaeon]|nr:cytidine deaminase [Candidatus Thermoplasmatota archaeon]
MVAASGGKASTPPPGLLEAAAEAARRSYAPYSKFHVGAAIRLSDGRIFSGANVENASYGLTICAERAAIFRAVAEAGPGIAIEEVAIVTSDLKDCAPCGACLQVTSEFGEDPRFLFYVGGRLRHAHLSDLMPQQFKLKLGL